MSQDDEHEQLGEQLSALADGELSREERAFLLRRLGHDGAARARLGRYFLMRDALQRTLPAQPDPGLAGRVRARIAEEPAHDAGSAKARGVPVMTGWRRPAMGGVLAATVAAVTVLWWQGGALPGGAREPATAGSDPAAEAPAPAPSAGSAVQPVTLGDRGGLSWPQQALRAPEPAGERQAVTSPMPQVLPSRVERLTTDPAERTEPGRTGDSAAYPAQQ